MRKLWLVVVFAVVFCWQVAAFAAGDVRVVTLTWSEDPATTQTITWQTDNSDSAQFLSYNKPGEAPMVIKAQTTSFVTDKRQNFISSVVVRGLEPNTNYDYAIGDGTAWTSTGKFITAVSSPAEPFQFLLFSDSQSYDYNVWGKNLSAAYKRYPEVKFFAVTGDLVDVGQSQAEWDNWFKSAQSVMKQLTIVPVVGNHETYTPERLFSLPIYFKAQFSLPQNAPTGMAGQVYSFDYGNVHFAVLDTQIGEERAFLPDSLELQQEWLKRDLAATNKLWKIVLMHRPAYSNRIKGGQEVSVAFRPIFDAYGVDVAFSGHDHVSARTSKLKAGVYDANGTVYMPLGRSGTKVYSAERVEAKPWNEHFFNPVSQPIYQVVSVAGNRLTIEVFNEDGTRVDMVILEK